MTDKTVEEKIRILCEETAREQGYLVIEFRIRKMKLHYSVELFIDKKDDLTLDNCADLSRLIGQKLEVEDPGLENFRLEISSPGVSRNLIYLDQYYKHIGRTFELTYKDAAGEEIKWKAALSRIENEQPVFKTAKGAELSIPFQSIVSAKVLVSFS
jgi:ribosome maturation factor RimP